MKINPNANQVLLPILAASVKFLQSLHKLSNLLHSTSWKRSVLRISIKIATIFMFQWALLLKMDPQLVSVSSPLLSQLQPVDQSPLIEKLTACKNHNITRVILPLSNRKDVKKLPEEFKRGFTIFYVTNIKQLYEICFPSEDHLLEDYQTAFIEKLNKMDI